MSIFRGFLVWLDEHQVGILTTIAVHLLVISIILVFKIKTYTQGDYGILIDLSMIDTTPEEIKPKEEQQTSVEELVNNYQEENLIRNIPVNVADERAKENVDKMVKDMKTELNITDPSPPRDVPAETSAKDDKATKDEAQIYDERYPANAAGERTVYRGATTVSYDLEGRRHTFMPYPGYKCRAGGKIVVKIVVNAYGYVMTTEIDRFESNSEDPCLIEEAKRDAERSRFNESTKARQEGSITYIFKAQ